MVEEEFPALLIFKWFGVTSVQQDRAAAKKVRIEVMITHIPTKKPAQIEEQEFLIGIETDMDFG